MGKFFEENIFICDCHSVTHQMVFCHSPKPESPEDYTVYVQVHLNKRSFWKRLKYGIKYIFGYTSNYGAFDEFIFQPEDAGKLLLISAWLATYQNKMNVENSINENKSK